MEWNDGTQMTAVTRRDTWPIKWSSSANITKYFPHTSNIFCQNKYFSQFGSDGMSPDPAVAIDKNPPNKIAKSPLKTQILARRIGPTHAWKRTEVLKHFCSTFPTSMWCLVDIFCAEAIIMFLVGFDVRMLVWIADDSPSQFSANFPQSWNTPVQWCVI